MQRYYFVGSVRLKRRRVMPTMFAILCIALAALSLPTRASETASESPQGNQVEKWLRMSNGENIAKGKEVWFSRQPNYTTFSKDRFAEKLTDGILSPKEDGEIWFSQQTVGWSSGADRGIDLLIDLGKQEPVEHVVARILGGGKQHTLVYPKEISVLLSNDGIVFHEASKKIKANDGEKELAESTPGIFFYLPEEGVAFVEPISLAVNARARYVVLRIVGASSWLFLDELAVIKSQAKEGLATIESFPRVSFISDGVRIEPRAKELVITPNLPTPNFFAVRDVRAKHEKDQVIQIEMDLPEAVCFLSSPVDVDRMEGAPKGRAHYRVSGQVSRYGFVGPYYLGLKEGALLEEGTEARISWISEGQLKNTVVVPIKAIMIPKVPASAAALNASLAWLGAREAREWPDFFTSYRNLGFSIVPVFPYFWNDSPSSSDFLQKARREGFRIVMNDSTFHRLLMRHKDKAEIFNRVNGKQGKHLCPAYSGSYYQEEIKRVADLARRCRPDFIFYDIETWQASATEAAQCKICKETQQQSGEKDWNAFLVSQGTRIMKDLHAASAGTAPDGSDPITGLYNTKAEPPVYHSVFDFRALYPGSIHLAQPSLYVQGNARMVGETVRQSYDKLNNRDIVPYLTPGTYGTYAPHQLEQMILEAYLNGAGGITYYVFRDFDPMTFYYHASALSKLAQFAPLLTKGKRIDALSSNEKLRCSAFGRETEALVLVGNYQNAAYNTGAIQFPKKVAFAREIDGVTNEKEVNLEHIVVEPDGHRLIHVIFQQ